MKELNDCITYLGYSIRGETPVDELDGIVNALEILIGTKKFLEKGKAAPTAPTAETDTDKNNLQSNDNTKSELLSRFPDGMRVDCPLGESIVVGHIRDHVAVDDGYGNWILYSPIELCPLKEEKCQVMEDDE